MAAPIQLAFSGDVGLFLPWDGSKDELHAPDPIDDSDFDTWSMLYLNVLWWLLSYFPRTTCAEEYARGDAAAAKSNSYFDEGNV